MKIQSMTIESSQTHSELCELGRSIGVDKSPYNTVAHRHPYTAVYSLLLSKFRQMPIRFAEIGIAGGASVVMWSLYFLSTQRQLYFFDIDKNCVQQANSFNIPLVSCHEMDVTKEESIREGLGKIGGNLDVLLDDSTHGIPEQVKIIKQGLPFVKPGGMIIIEDVFRRYKEEDYQKELEDVLDQFAFATFITTEHALRWSPDWDNDKLLVLIKK